MSWVHPPAGATDVDVVVFQGHVALAGAVSYPCTAAGMPSTATCPIVGSGGTIGGNTRGFVLASSVCATAVDDTTPVHVGGGSCAVSAAGTFHGSCGLFNGTASWSLATSTIGVPTNSNRTRTGLLSFISVGGAVVVTATVHGGGLGGGVLHAVPVPAVVGTTVDNSCSAQTADEFELAGSLAFATP